MSKKIHKTKSEVMNFFKRPDPETIFEDLDKMEPKGVKSCCVCNTNASLCVPEQMFGSYVTSFAAQSISYWVT